MHPRPTLSANDYPTRVGNLIDACDRRLKGNLLINGAFQVWQRGTSFASGGAVVYTADRWAFYRTGLVAGATASQQVGSQARNCMRLQRDNGNASTAGLILVQSLETEDSMPYHSKYLAAGFRARAGANFSAAGGLFTASIVTATGVDQSYHATYTGQAILTSAAGVLTTSWQDFVVTAAVAPANMTEMALFCSFIPVGTAGAADYAEVEQIQFIPGEFVGEFPYRSMAEELVNCRRYARIEDFRIPATTAVSERINMRAIPTISGGGAGYTSTGTTKDALVHFQTTGAVATLTLTADI